MFSGEKWVSIPRMSPCANRVVASTAPVMKPTPSGLHGTNPMPVEKVDPVGTEALQHRIDTTPNALGRRVRLGGNPLPGMQVDVPPELRGDLDLVPERLHGFAEDPLHLERPIGFRCVEERDTSVEGSPNDVEHLRPTGHRGLISTAHVRHTRPHGRDVEVTQPTPRRQVRSWPTTRRSGTAWGWSSNTLTRRPGPRPLQPTRRACLDDSSP
jgi:hypothetical protein